MNELEAVARGQSFLDDITDDLAAIDEQIVVHVGKKKAVEKEPEIVCKPFQPWADIPPRRIIEVAGMRFYAKGFLSMTGAAGGSGKTSLSIVEELSLALGIDLLAPKVGGEFCTLKCGRQRVWCMSLEDDEEEHQRRVAGVIGHYGLHDLIDDLGDWYAVTYKSDSPVTLAAVSGGTLIVTPHAAEVARIVAERKVDVITADPFVNTHLVPENDNGGMNKVADLWRGIAQGAGVAIALTHHIRKQGGAGEVSADDLRGAVSLVGAARMVRVLQPMNKDEANRFGIDLERRRFYVWVNPAAKANILPPADRRSWFHLASWHLDNATDHWDADSIGVIESWAPPDALEGVTSAHVAELARRLRNADDEFLLSHCRENRQAGGWIGNLIAEIVGEGAGDIGRIIAAWLSCGVLQRVSVRDTKKGENRPCLTLGKAALKGDDF